jgi:hypothetical protein
MAEMSGFVRVAESRSRKSAANVSEVESEGSVVEEESEATPVTGIVPKTAHNFVDRMVSVNDLSVDPQIQRYRFNNRKVERMVASYNGDAIGILTVSQRNAITLSIVDGWHRWETVRRLTDSTGEILCRVFTGLSLAEEAQMFLDLNPGNQPNAMDRYRMRYLTGDPVIVTIDSYLHDYGWAVNPQRAPGHVQCVAALERIYRNSQRREAWSGMLPEAIRIVSRAWGNQQEAATATLLEAVAALVQEYGARMDTDRLITVLKEYSGGPAVVASDGQQVARLRKIRTPMGVADAIVTAYNKGLRVGGPNELPAWRRAR